MCPRFVGKIISTRACPWRTSGFGTHMGPLPANSGSTTSRNACRIAVIRILINEPSGKWVIVRMETKGALA